MSISPAHYSIQKREEWQTAFRQNKSLLASSFARHFADKIAEDMQQALKDLASHPFFPYTRFDRISRCTKHNLFLNSPERINEFIQIFERYLPPEERLPPFDEWIPGIAKWKNDFDLVYFTNQFEQFYKQAKTEIKKELREKKINAVSFSKLSMHFSWNYHLTHQLVVNQESRICLESKEKCRNLWLLQFRENCDELAANIATSISLKMIDEIKKRSQNPMLPRPDTYIDWKQKQSTPELLTWFHSLLYKKQRIAPLAEWIEGFTSHLNDKMPYDSDFFDPLMKQLLEKVSVELEKRSKANGLAFSMYFAGGNINITFYQKI